MTELKDKINHGLKPKTHDSRDYKLGIVFKLPALSELPSSLTIGLPEVRNQRESDFCAAFASSSCSTIQEFAELCPEWIFAATKGMLNDVTSYGLELRDVCKGHALFGCIERAESPFSVDNKPVDFLRNIKNWPPDLFQKALKHKKGSYFSVEDVSNGYDHYDNIRRAMYYFRNENCALIFGTLWGWDIAQQVMTSPCQQGSGHALLGIGYDIQGIYVQNSYGTENVGLCGRHYFSREVVNASVEMYGAYMFHDMTKEDAQYFTVNNMKVTDNWFVQIVKIILNIFK